MRRRFLARHPKSELYAGFADFAFWRMDVVSAHLNGGFARAADLKAPDILTDLAGADDLVAAEDGAVAHMNEDHAEAVGLYATKLLGARDGDWRITGIDPDGPRHDAGRHDAAAAIRRSASPTPEQLRKVLVALAAEARGDAASSR